jgi:peptide/nickel transport system permease protein
MGAYLLKRVLLLLPTAIVPVLLVFLMLQLAPGDPVAVLLGDNATPQQTAELRAELGLDEPLMTQFLSFFGSLLTLDLGNSLFLGEPVVESVLAHGVITAQLTLLALLIAVVLGASAGILSAIYHNRVIDKVTRLLAVLGVAIPEFWLALLLILGFAVTFRWFPVSGYTPASQGLLESLKSLTLPALALGLVHAAFIARMMRSSVLDVLGEQFVDTARAKGLGARQVIGRHVLRAASVPIVTVIGLTMAILLGGAIAVETIFSLPGLGRLLVQAVSRRDYPLIQGVVLVVAIAYVLINLLVDIVYALLDPRVRYQ